MRFLLDIVAASGASLPSVVLFRLGSMRPKNVSTFLNLILERHSPAFGEGAIISVTEKKIRVRPLPIEMKGRLHSRG